jgi:phosphoribosylanthranilate isomerase
MLHRTRIKICGLTCRADLQVAIDAGADAIGLVFYPDSPRYLSPAVAGELITELPPFVSSVGLLVNAALEQARSIVAQAPVSLLQFHGDESAGQCAEIAHAVNRPFLRALRIGATTTGADLLECERQYRAASPLFSGLVLDALVEGYGGGGKVFDWSLVPQELAPRVVLSGGLSAQNAADAIQWLRPYALDVSSGVESSKGIKDPARIRAFIDAVRQADASL